MRGKRGQDRCHRKRKHTHTHTLLLRHMHHTHDVTHYFCFGGKELDHHTLFISTSFSSHMWLSSSHQIFTVGPIKHSLRSTFICPPPTSLQRVHQKPTKSLKTRAQSAYMVGEVVQCRTGGGDWTKRWEMGELHQKKLAQGEMRHIRETPDEGTEQRRRVWRPLQRRSCSAREEKPRTSIIQQ